MNPVIPIFLFVNEPGAPFLETAVRSIRENASRLFRYRIHVLGDTISTNLNLKNFPDADFELRTGSLPLLQLPSGVPVPSLSSFVRLFIAQLYPEYDKVICLSADLAVTGDISCLYAEPLGNKLIGAAVGPGNRINPDVLLLNCRRMREEDLAGQLMAWLADKTNSNETKPGIAPDSLKDFLSTLHRSSIQYLDPDWNATPCDHVPVTDDIHVIHFTPDARFNDAFWQYALSLA